MDSRLQTGNMRFLKASRVCRKCGSMHCVRCALPLLGEGSTMPSMVLARGTPKQHAMGLRMKRNDLWRLIHWKPGPRIWIE